jgi:cytochrome c oxidase subunit IV
VSEFDVLTTTAETVEGHGAQLDGHGPEFVHGPTDRQYVIVAIVLSALTGMEVFTYFKSVVDFGPFLMPMLLVLMGVKFYLIAAFFMHLRYDRAILRRFFLTGIVLAVVVYNIALLTFKLFASGVPH